MFYFQSTSGSPLDRTVSSVDVKGNVRLLSPQTGTSSAEFNATHTYYVWKYSDIQTPTTYVLCNAKGKEVRKIEMNAAYAEKYAGRMPSKEFSRWPMRQATR